MTDKWQKQLEQVPIDWGRAVGWAMWHAIDASGRGHWFQREPRRGDMGWGPSIGRWHGDREYDIPIGVDWRILVRKREEGGVGDRKALDAVEWALSYLFHQVQAGIGSWSADESAAVKKEIGEVLGWIERFREERKEGEDVKPVTEAAEGEEKESGRRGVLTAAAAGRGSGKKEEAAGVGPGKEEVGPPLTEAKDGPSVDVGGAAGAASGDARSIDGHSIDGHGVLPVGFHGRQAAILDRRWSNVGKAWLPTVVKEAFWEVWKATVNGEPPPPLAMNTLAIFFNSSGIDYFELGKRLPGLAGQWEQVIPGVDGRRGVGGETETNWEISRAWGMMLSMLGNAWGHDFGPYVLLRRTKVDKSR